MYENTIKSTMSIRKGRGSLNHNKRKIIADNVDPTRTKNNIVLVDEDIKKVYDDVFGESVKEYNDKQSRSDRKIKSYYEKIKHSNQEKPFYELIVEIGNIDNDKNNKKINEVQPEILTKFLQKFQEKYNSNIKVFGAYIHMDESTGPHLHLDYIPIGHSLNRGLKICNSHNKAMMELGYIDVNEKGKNIGSFNKWYDDLFQDLEEISLQYGIEKNNNLDSNEKGVSIKEYRLQKDRAEELKEENDELAKTNSELSLKNTSLKISNKKLEEDKEELEKTIEYSKTYKEDLENSITNQNYQAKFNKLYNLVWKVVDPIISKLEVWKNSFSLLTPVINKLNNLLDNTNKIFDNEEIIEEDKSNDDYEL